MQVFISHSNRDDAFVTRLAADLRAAGLLTWVDHENILPGKDWDDLVSAALDGSDAMVLVMSPASVESKNVKVEWSYFFELDKPIYPVVCEPCRVPFRLRLHQQLDFTNHGGKAMGDLLAVLASTTAGRGASIEEPETILIPAGPFFMGSDQNQDPYATAHELPQIMITLPAYRIGRYPVTVAEFRTFVDAGGYKERRFWTDAGWFDKGSRAQPHDWEIVRTSDPLLPVVHVNWYGSVAYCRWLAEITKAPYRLPTEAEWEKAARGVDGRIYPWGDDWRDDACNTADDGHEPATPVGAFSPAGDSPYGAADMSGNVWEWCQTKWREDYHLPADDDPRGTEPRVLRGGSWNSVFRAARAAARHWFNPDHVGDEQGFRVALTVEE